MLPFSKAQASLSSPPGCLVKVTGSWARGSDWLIKMNEGGKEKGLRSNTRLVVTEDKEGLLEVVETSQGPDGEMNTVQEM